ncbi:MAG TPA: hypothetical protein VKW06_20905 [Candidatus Angelobacter sp.]|nr:hypothetical protein [Candidatus Angelobacter sp.]
MGQIIRSTGTTRLAYLQFCKAAILLLSGLAAILSPSGWPNSKHLVMAAVYIAAHSIQLPPVFNILLAIYPAVVGWGLWRMRNWARVALIISSGLMVIRWLTALFATQWASGETILHTPLARMTVWTLIILDSVIFLYLMQPEVRSAFGETSDYSQ